MDVIARTASQTESAPTRGDVDSRDAGAERIVGDSRRALVILLGGIVRRSADSLRQPREHLVWASNRASATRKSQSRAALAPSGSRVVAQLLTESLLCLWSEVPGNWARHVDHQCPGSPAIPHAIPLLVKSDRRQRLAFASFSPSPRGILSYCLPAWHVDADLAAVLRRAASPCRPG